MRILPVKVIPEMTYTVSGGTLNPIHTHSLQHHKWFITGKRQCFCSKKFNVNKKC